MMDWPGLIGTIAASLTAGGGLGVGLKAWHDRQELEGKQRLAEADQPVDQYAEMVKELRAEQARLGNVIDTMRREYEQALAESRKEHADCLLRFGRLEGQLDEMRRHVRQVETSASEQHKKAIAETAVMGNRVIKAAAATAMDVAKKVASDSGIIGGPTVDRDHPLPVEIINPAVTEE